MQLSLISLKVKSETEYCLSFNTELHKVTVGEFVIKKHPEVVETVRKLRKYGIKYDVLY